MTSQITTEEIIELGLDSGLTAVGVCSAEKLAMSESILESRKKKGLNSDMQFTYRNPSRSCDPFKVLPSAKSLVAAAFSYGDATQASYETLKDEAGSAVVARYARNESYLGLRDSLNEIAAKLKGLGFKAVVVSDSNALVDREVAWRAGIGWYGKNSNLLSSETGSWTVLGSVVTNAELEPTSGPMQDGCGSCTKCIDYCPTNAIIAPGVVDASRCISWLVQSKEPIPLEFRVAVGTRIYGCDDCQEICPPNRVKFGESKDNLNSQNALIDIFWMLSANNEELITKCETWYFPERNPDYIRRTALVALGNSAVEKDLRTVNTLKRFLSSENVLLRSHAVWAVKRLGLQSLLTDINLDDQGIIQMELDADVPLRSIPV